MDYIEELKKIRTELLEMENTHQKAPLYKILAYKSALDDFVTKEYKKFFNDVVGTIPGVPFSETENEPIKVNQRLKLNALTDIRALPEKERKKALLNAKRKEKELAQLVEPYFGHSSLRGIIEKHYPIKEIELGK